MNDIFQLDEIIRLRSLLNQHVWINKCRVETADGEFVGHVYDYFVDSKMMILTKILTVKTYFGLFKGDAFLIPRKEIIKIEKNIITVRDLYKKYAIKERKFAMGKGLKPDIA
jgi:sporulation protein YlmC with PRC-barrel domain